ncbi:MAG: HlyD family efflux transporter periplasmic adaptor subunit [Phycisphaerales bacterium]|nr:HlyD family efflux transporter periplasmic adaptor subunit [Phycisphaerales bacterium]
MATPSHADAGRGFQLLSTHEWEDAVATFRYLLDAPRGAVLRYRHGLAPQHVAGDDAFAASDAVAHLAGLLARSGDGRSEVIEVGRERLRALVVPLFAEAPEYLLALQLPRLDAAAVNAAAARLAHAAPVVSRLRAAASARLASLEIDAHRAALDVMSRVQQHLRFQSAAIEICNVLNARLRADRTTLCLIRGWHARLIAVSDAERIMPHTTLVHRIEAASEECADQDGPVILPATEWIDVAPIARAAGHLAAHAEATGVAVLPFADADGEPFAALTVLRSDGEAWSPGDLRMLEETTHLLGPVLHRVHADDRNIVSRLIGALADPLWRSGPGRRHPWLRLAACLGTLLLILAALLQRDHVVVAPGVVTYAEQSVVSAPFDGALTGIHARVGDRVGRGAVLARMDKRPLDLRIAALGAEVSALEREADMARTDGDATEVRIAQLHADEARVRLDAARAERERAELAAARDAIVLAGDHDEMEGQQVPAGMPIFTLGHLGSRLVRLHVSEGSRHLIAAGGEVHLTFHVDGYRTLAGRIERIDQRASLQHGINGFDVDVRVEPMPDWLRPGMSGRGRIVVGRRSWLEDAGARLAAPIREWAFRMW